MPGGAATFRAASLAKRFHTPDGRVLEVLRRVDLALAPGELVAVVGRSGSGKSTLLNLLGCLDRSDGGELWFGDERLTGASRRALARFRGRHLGFVFQTYNLIPELTAWENVLLAARYVGRARSQAETAARGLLERLSVWERADHYPPALSGGEQQRVAFCRAVLNDPAVILADELSGCGERGRAAGGAPGPGAERPLGGAAGDAQCGPRPWRGPRAHADERSAHRGQALTS
jgi:ABC-type lipoprotein export system ATPase subunit